MDGCGCVDTDIWIHGYGNVHMSIYRYVDIWVDMGIWIHGPMEILLWICGYRYMDMDGWILITSGRITQTVFPCP